MKYPLTNLGIRRLQKRLRELVIYHGPIDGKMNDLLLRSIKGFQRISGLLQDGIVGALTEAELFPLLVPGLRIDIDGPSDDKLTNTKINAFPREKNVERYYGKMGKNQGSFVPPFRMVLAWEPKTVLKKIIIHEKLVSSAERCFDRVAHEYDTEAKRRALGLHLFGGSLAVRKKRGGTGWSMHSWGIAIDFDPLRNQLRWNHTKARLAQRDAGMFFKIWAEEGWLGLGPARDYDWQHLQAARLG